MYILRSFVLVFVIVLFIGYKIRRSDRIMRTASENFWEKENQANNIRKKSLDSLEFLHPSEEIVTLVESINSTDATIMDHRSELLRVLGSDIVNLSGITNTDLKLQYGVANLNYLSQCDDNFTSLVNLISRLGGELLNAGYVDTAIQLLAYGISVDSDVTANYSLLANHYVSIGDRAKIDELILKASTLKSIKREPILNMLKSL